MFRKLLCWMGLHSWWYPLHNGRVAMRRTCNFCKRTDIGYTIQGGKRGISWTKKVKVN